MESPALEILECSTGHFLSMAKMQTVLKRSSIRLWLRLDRQKCELFQSYRTSHYKSTRRRLTAIEYPLV